jgi:pimeloyl-ACP methyl ester carboxylesterase
MGTLPAATCTAYHPFAMASEPLTRYARSGDVHLAYHVTGEGPLDLLLVPDGMIPIEAIPEEPSFDRFVRRLGRFCRVIRFDRRGMGLSDPVTPSNPPTLEQWMEDAEAVLDAVGAEQAALLGMAEGGFVVSLLAATRPQRVISLVLIHATSSYTAEPFGGGPAADALDRLGGTVEEAWGDVSWGIPLFAPSAVGEDRYRDWLQRAIRHSLSPAMARAVFDVMFRSDIRDVLPAIRVPTLVIHRRGNQYLGSEHSRYLADHIPGARYVDVEGRDHVPYLGDQEPILEVVEEFLTGGRKPPEADRVLATILFTDIVGSTEKGRGGGRRPLARASPGAPRGHPARAGAIPRSGDRCDRRWSLRRLRRSGPCRAVRLRDRLGRATTRVGGQSRGPHGRVRGGRSQAGGHRRSHRSQSRRDGRARRGVGLEHGEGPGGGLRSEVRGSWSSRPEGNPRRVAHLRRGEGLACPRTWKVSGR